MLTHCHALRNGINAGQAANYRYVQFLNGFFFLDPMFSWSNSKVLRKIRF